MFWVKILILFHVDPGSGMENSDLGSGMDKSRIRDPATLPGSVNYFHNQFKIPGFIVFSCNPY
jgi:hypothetical protein